VQELLRPQLLLLGGGFAGGLPGLETLLSAHLVHMARPGHPPLDVRPASLGALSSLRGALALARLSR
jgi:kanosamine 6-kinase